MSLSWVGPIAMVNSLISGISDYLESENRVRNARLSEELVDFACGKNNLLAEHVIAFQQRRWQAVIELLESNLIAAEMTLEKHLQLRREIARKISCATNIIELEICLNVQKLFVAAWHGQIRQIQDSCCENLAELLWRDQKEVQKFLENFT